MQCGRSVQENHNATLPVQSTIDQVWCAACEVWCLRYKAYLHEQILAELFWHTHLPKTPFPRCRHAARPHGPVKHLITH
eukprot:9570-Eustigmatos_ZCMA.PRE.1